LWTSRDPGARLAFPPEVAAHLVKLACALPDKADRSLSLWTCGQLAIQLTADGTVESISPKSVQRILQSSKLKPWRVHDWLSPKVARDEAFRGRVLSIMDLYTRELGAEEVAYSLDEKTSLQPRTRAHETKPPQAGNKPALLEHEYARKGALQLFAAFNLRSGEVVGVLRRRKRQVEFTARGFAVLVDLTVLRFARTVRVIELLEAIEAKHPASIRWIHLVCDNVSVHHGKLVRAWLARHPRFQMHFTPVHCSWMNRTVRSEAKYSEVDEHGRRPRAVNQVEQWFSILQRRRLTAPNFEDLQDLERKVLGFIAQWNAQAHPFRWSKRSFDKVLAKIDAELAIAA
jgi:hypothetical protein